MTQCRRIRPRHTPRLSRVLIECREPQNLDTLVDLLKKANNLPQSIRRTTANEYGFIPTQLQAAATWEDESGYNNCTQHCSHQPAHVAWADLSDDQRCTFMRRYSQFLTNCTTDELQLILLADSGPFRKVALTIDLWADEEEETEPCQEKAEPREGETEPFMSATTATPATASRMLSVHTQAILDSRPGANPYPHPAGQNDRHHFPSFLTTIPTGRKRRLTAP